MDDVDTERGRRHDHDRRDVDLTEESDGMREPDEADQGDEHG